MQNLRVNRDTYACYLAIGFVVISILLTSAHRTEAQHAGHATQEPVHITMEALHAAGGVPPGWQFTLPVGDVEAGREVFTTMQCYTCHHVAGETFPAYPPRKEAGPDLSEMGAHHPAAYFAESILNPNAVIVTGEGYTGPDGRSRMPGYDEMSLGQLTDLVAYLKSLGTSSAHMGHDSHGHQHQPTGSRPHDHSGHGSHHRNP
jgi:hypothetical protein